MKRRNFLKSLGMGALASLIPDRISERKPPQVEPYEGEEIRIVEYTDDLCSGEWHAYPGRYMRAVINWRKRWPSKT